jgi:glucokinase
MDTVVAVDVGGTNLKCAVVTGDGEALWTARHPTARDRGPDAVVGTVLDVVQELTGQARTAGSTPRAVGIVVPGLVDEEHGTALYSANIGWRNVPLREAAERQLGLPTVLGHDVRAGALAEARLGAGRGADHVLFVAIGTGIAAAYVVAGRVTTGAHGLAGELGHLVVRPSGPVCGCGQRGCLEAVSGAAAIGRRYLALTGTPATAAAVAHRAATGEPAARSVWGEAVEALADGLLGVIALLDPQLVVIGGGLSGAGSILFAPLTRALEARRSFHARPRLVPARLGDNAGCLGAAQLALDKLAAQLALDKLAAGRFASDQPVEL